MHRYNPVLEAAQHSALNDVCGEELRSIWQDPRFARYVRHYREGVASPPSRFAYISSALRSDRSAGAKLLTATPWERWRLRVQQNELLRQAAKDLRQSMDHYFRNANLLGTFPMEEILVRRQRMNVRYMRFRLYLAMDTFNVTSMRALAAQMIDEIIALSVPDVVPINALRRA